MQKCLINLTNSLNTVVDILVKQSVSLYLAAEDRDSEELMILRVVMNHGEIPFHYMCQSGWPEHICVSVTVKSPNFDTFPQCLKITKKVAFNIASEASYVYILSGQKFIKDAKNGQFWRVFENLNLLSNSVTRQVNFNIKNAIF